MFNWCWPARESQLWLSNFWTKRLLWLRAKRGRSCGHAAQYSCLRVSGPLFAAVTVFDSPSNAQNSLFAYWAKQATSPGEGERIFCCGQCPFDQRSNRLVVGRCWGMCARCKSRTIHWASSLEQSKFFILTNPCEMTDRWLLFCGFFARYTQSNKRVNQMRKWVRPDPTDLIVRQSAQHLSPKLISSIS